jgi:hypothetical protein
MGGEDSDFHGTLLKINKFLLVPLPQYYKTLVLTCKEEIYGNREFPHHTWARGGAFWENLRGRTSQLPKIKGRTSL